MKKAVSIILLAVMILATSVNVFAAEVTSPGDASSDVVLTAAGANFSVTVPMTLPVEVDAEGIVTVASNAQIVNNSVGAVEVSDINLTSEAGWTIVPYGTDMSGEVVGAQKFSFDINGNSTIAGSFSYTGAGFTSIAGNGGSLALTYDSEVPAQVGAMTDSKIATVVFTVGWAE